MKSVKAQLPVTLAAVAVAAAFFVYLGLPPDRGVFLGAVKGDVGAVRRNIRWGADVNARHIWGCTLLHWTNDKDIATLLITKNAEVNAKDNEGRTPLQIAVEFGKVEVADLLRRHGARE